MDGDERLNRLEERVAALLDLNANLARGRERVEVGGATLRVMAREPLADEVERLADEVSRLAHEVERLASERDEACREAARMSSELERYRHAQAKLHQELDGLRRSLDDAEVFRRRRGVRAVVWLADRVPRARR